MFSKSKKLVAIALTAVMATSVLAGCSVEVTSTPSGGKPGASGTASGTEVSATDILKDVKQATGEENNISLKVWGPNDSKELLEKQCKDFIAMYPEKKISITVEVQGESDAKAAVMKDADAAADVFGIPSDQFNALAKDGYLSLARKQFATAIKEENLQGAVDVVTYKDQIFAYPETGDNGYLLFYDKSVLSDEDIASMENLMAACEKKNKKFIMNMGDGFYSCMVPFTAGGTLDIKEVEEDGSVEEYQVLNYDEKKVESVAKSFTDLLCGNKNFQSDDVNTVLVSGLKNGTHAAGVVGPWQSKAIKAALGKNFGAAKLPTIKVDGKDTQMVSMHGYKMLCVKAKTKFPVTANSLAYYLTNEAAQRERCTTLGWGPSNKKVVDEDGVKNDPTLVAVYAQQKFSIPQTKLTTAFWDPTGTYGAYLVDEKKDHSDAKMVSEYKLMVENITAG